MTADLERHLTQRGLKMISPEEGPKLLLDELQFGKKGQTEVIMARATEEAAAAGWTMPEIGSTPVTESDRIIAATA